MQRINYITNLEINTTSGGWGGINFNIYNQLNKSYPTNYIGPINPPFYIHEKAISKIYRLLGKKGKFSFFSNARLRKINKLVEESIETSDNASFNFYFGQTSWIGCNSRLPYACYIDADFLTYLKIFSNPSVFQKEDILRIAQLEANWLRKFSLIFYGSNWAKDLTLRNYELIDDPNKHIVINTGGHMQIPKEDTFDWDQDGINLLFIDYFIGKRFTVSIDPDNTLINFLQRMFKFKMAGEFKKTPGFTVPFMSFALMYLCLPLRNMPKDSDFPLLMVFVLVLLTLSSIITSVKLLGYPVIHLVSIILGLLWGTAWYAIVKGKKEHPSGDTYFSANSSNTAKCSRPSTQAFKCTVYKNGKPVGDINT